MTLPTPDQLRDQPKPPATNPINDRSAWHRRASRPVLVWMAALLVAAVASLFIDLRWLLVHIATLGIITNSILIWGQHFTEALLKVRLADSARDWQVRRIWLLNLGAATTMVGMLGGNPTATAIGAGQVAAALTWYVVDLVVQLKKALPSRFAIVVRFYAIAAALLVVGAGFGAALAFNLADPWPGRLLLAHLAANLLGFVALTAVGTLITLWPTVLRTQMVPGQDAAGRRSLWLMLAGLLVATTGALTGLRPLAAAGIALHLLGLVVIGIPLVACAVRKPPRDLPGYGLAAAFGWLVLLDALAIATLLRAPGGTLAVTDLQPLTPILVVGFLLQLLISAMSYLMPSVMGGGPLVVRASTVAMQRFGALRVVVLNAALVVWLLADDPLTTRLSQGLVVLALASVLPATAHMIATHIKARRDQSTGELTKPVEREPVTETPIADLGRRDLLEGAAALAVVASAAVAPAVLGHRSSVAATGRTTSVELVSRDMRYVPDHIVVPAGDRLQITLRNDDPIEVHDLVIGTATTGRLAPGSTGTLTTGPIGGATEGWCSVGQHRAMGMVLSITTDAAAGSADESAELARVRADLSQPPGAAHQARDAALPQLPAGRSQELVLTVTEPPLELAPQVTMAAMVYNDQVMAPTIRARRGDEIKVRLVNNGSMGHSIDFHAGTVAPNEVMRTINPGESLDYRFVTHRSGIWLYHCSTMPMSAHVAAGMYGAVVVSPDDLAKADREYLLVQSDHYLNPAVLAGRQSPHQGHTPSSNDPTPTHDLTGALAVSTAKIAAERPDFVVFNGHANHYVHAPLTAKVGERVRIWLLSAGPSRGMSFHVVGSQFDTVWKEGAFLLDARTNSGGGSQALDLAAAQGGFVEMVFTEAGRYTFVNHSFVDAERGARGFIDVS